MSARPTPDRLTPERIAEIRERAGFAADLSDSKIVARSALDVPDLLAEVDTLAAKLEKSEREQRSLIAGVRTVAEAAYVYQRDRARALNVDALALVRDIEWAPYTHYVKPTGQCRSCWGLEPRDEADTHHLSGHRADCNLAALKTRLETAVAEYDPAPNPGPSLVEALLAEAIELTCDVDTDKPTLESEKALIALDDAIDASLLPRLARPSLQRHFDELRAKVWQALADEVHPLHELVKAAGACVCPKDRT